MHWYLTAFVVGALVGYGLYVWGSLARSIGISLALIEDTIAYEQHPISPQVRILVAGDSTAVGVGAQGEDSIAGRIGKDMPDADITNLGRSGTRLAVLLEMLRAQEGKEYDLVLLQIGANDITGRTSYANIKSRLAQALALASTLSPRVIVMTAGNVGLSPAFKWPLSAYITQRTRVVRELFITEVGEHPGAVYVDLFNEVADEPFNKDVPRYYAPDYFHPSGEGYGLWYQKLRSSLQQ